MDEGNIISLSKRLILFQRIFTRSTVMHFCYFEWALYPLKFLNSSYQRSIGTRVSEPNVAKPERPHFSSLFPALRGDNHRSYHCPTGW